jgi:hypothetical protein
MNLSGQPRLPVQISVSKGYICKLF